jgi:SAM-dependent methyltransferase
MPSTLTGVSMDHNLLLNKLCPICSSDRIHYWGTAPDMGHPETSHRLSKCVVCTHLFINPLPSADFLSHAYKSQDASVFSNNGFFENRSSSPFSGGDHWILKYLSEIHHPADYLDIGSANLKLLLEIKALGWKVTVVEPSPHAEQLQKALNIEAYKILFENCKFLNQYQVISAIDVLEHVHSPIHFLRKVQESLVYDGFALFRFPNSKSLKCRLEREKWGMIRPLGHLHYFSPFSFRHACQVCKLKIDRLVSNDFSHYRSLSIFEIPLRGLRFLAIFERLFDRLLLGDQLLVKVSHV